MNQISGRRRGMALLTVVILMIGMFGATGSIFMVVTTRARAMTDRVAERSAFYLAESGIEASKYEISQSEDPDANGVGNAVFDGAGGSYEAQAEDRGDGTWKITSTGVSGERQLTIESIVGQEERSRFPTAAVSIVGDVDDSKFKFKWRSKLLIDGDDTPAFTVSSRKFFDKLGVDLATDVARGKLPADSLLGSGLNSFTPKNRRRDKKSSPLPDDVRAFLKKQLGSKEGKKFATALENRERPVEDLLRLAPSELSDSIETWRARMDVAAGDVELPIQLNESYSSHLSDLTDVYDNLLSTVNDDLSPNADVTLADDRSALKKQIRDTEKALQDLKRSGNKRKGADQVSGKLASELESRLAALKDRLANENKISYGTPEAPVTLYVTKKLDLKKSDYITGHGTLIIDDKLVLRKGATFDWNGDVFVVGSDRKRAQVKVHGGDFKVEGNLVILGHGRGEDHVRMEVDRGGEAAVDGSLFMSTAYSENKKGRAHLKVLNGDLKVDGLFTMVGRRNTAHFGKNSDVTMNGMWQIGSPEGRGKEKVSLNLNGNLTVVKDTKGIEKGVGLLNRLGADLDVSSLSSKLTTNEMTSYSWNVKK